jgi:uncharacterized protein
MKYLLVFAILGIAVWLWRHNRRSDPSEKEQVQSKNKPNAVAKPLPMLRCAACGVHLPAADALSGSQGSYCSLAHRSQKEG